MSMKDTGVPAVAKIKGIVQEMRSDRCKNESYYRKFSINYSDSYRNQKGEVVYENMKQWVVGFNEVARHIKATIADGDEVLVIGRLKSREIVNRVQEVFIEIEEIEDIVKIPALGEI
jgi:single-stranded DNA-binding protein